MNEIQNSTDSSILSDTTNINRSSNTQSSQDSEKSVSFKHREFNGIFERSFTNRNSKVKCIGCGWMRSSNKQRSWAEHAANCEKLPASARLNCKDLYDRLQGYELLNTGSRSVEDSIKLIRVFIQYNVPLSIFDSLEFKALMKRNCPRWSLPGRKLISDKYLPHMTKRIERDFREKVDAIGNHSLSVEFDHWSDISNRSVLAVMASFPDGSRYLISLEDVSLLSHDSDSIKNSVLKSIKDIGESKIKSFISDSAASCKLARTKLVSLKDYEHAIEHRCLAHFINLIGSKITCEDDMKRMIHWGNRITKYLSQTISISGLLREAGVGKISKSTPTRWYSTVTMMEKLLINRDDIISNMEGLKQVDDCIFSKLKEESFWRSVYEAIKILRPLNQCIAIAERETSSIGETVKMLLEFSKSLFTCDWDEKLILTSIKAFLSYFNRDKLSGNEMGILLAAYCFERRFNKSYLTEDARALIFDTTLNLAKFSGYSNREIDQNFDKEFDRYFDGIGSYRRIQKEDESSLDWWSKQPDTILSTVVKRLTRLRSSSANVERLFSSLRIIQAPIRTNYSLGTLESISKIKESSLEMNTEEETDTDFEVECHLSSTRKRKGIPTSFESFELNCQSSCANPGLLTGDFRKFYNQFIQLIDFNNISTEEDSISSLETLEEPSIEDIIRRYREKRSNISSE